MMRDHIFVGYKWSFKTGGLTSKVYLAISNRNAAKNKQSPTKEWFLIKGSLVAGFAVPETATARF